MAFYDNLGKRIQQTGQGALDWTRRNTEVTRLNGIISGLEKEITSHYTEIGRLYYQKHAGDEQDPDLVAHFQSISDNLKTIEDCKNQISELKGYRKCVKCGKEISGTAVFCNYCGARQIPEYTASPSGRTCPNCGAPLEDDQVFCIECGTRVQVSEPEPAPEPELEPVPDPEPEPESEPEPDPNPEPTSAPEPESAPAPEAEAETMRFCVHCGSPLEEGDLFCQNCGQKVEN